MYKRELRAYQEKLLKEIGETKFFSWKRFWKTLELTSICEELDH